MEVTAPARRPISADMFTDLIGPGCVVESIRASGSDLTVEFSCDLPAATVTSIRDRMMSRDDMDQAARAHLRDLRAAASAADLTTSGGLEALRALLLAEADYLLGDA